MAGFAAALGHRTRPSHASVAPASLRTVLAPSLALLAACAAASAARAQGYDVLAECMALTGDEDAIHACLDNYLDDTDDDLGELEAFLERELDGKALEGFARSQAAFASYRRENCLWYLEFNEPRADAEKIAKNCLARMSLDRLSELQSLLVRDSDAGRAVNGFYVYGANRNSFRPCSTNARYWVEGEASAVGQLQQGYSSLATAELQVMFASVIGAIDEEAESPVDHDGVMRVRAVRDVRVPSDGDCRLPDGSPPVTAAADPDGPAPSVAERVADVPPSRADDIDIDVDRDAIARADDGDAADERAGTGVEADADPTDGWTVYSNDPSRAVGTNPVADPDSVRPPVPPVAPAPSTPAAPAVAEAATVAAPGDGERLTAYFGAWQADCGAGEAGARRCRVAVALGGEGSPELALLRRAPNDTTVEIAFPDRAVAAMDDVAWTIDGRALDTGGTEGDVSADGEDTLLRIVDRPFVREDLLPLMRGGRALSLEVASGDGAPERLEGTLMGLTRALGFADGFLADTGDGS